MTEPEISLCSSRAIKSAKVIGQGNHTLLAFQAMRFFRLKHLIR